MDSCDERLARVSPFTAEAALLQRPSVCNNLVRVPFAFTYANPNRAMLLDFFTRPDHSLVGGDECWEMRLAADAIEILQSGFDGGVVDVSAPILQYLTVGVSCSAVYVLED